MTSQQILTVADVARLRQTDRTSAYRWLQSNAKKHLKRRGRVWVISLAAYRSLHQDSDHEKILHRLAALEEAVRDAANRLDAHARELSKLRNPLF